MFLIHINGQVWFINCAVQPRKCFKANYETAKKKKKKKSAVHLQFKAKNGLESPLCFFVFPLSFKFLSLRYVDDSNFFLCHALNCKLWKHEKKKEPQE